MPDTFTPATLAARWHCDPEKVCALIASKKLPAVNTVANPNARRPRWVIPAEAVQQFEAARSTTSQPRQSKRKPTRTWKEFF